MAKLVVALFGKPSRAHNVVRALIDNEFLRENISLIVYQSVNQSNDPIHLPAGAGPDFTTGSQALKTPGAESLLGGLAGLLSGLASITVPGQGAILAAGPVSVELMSLSSGQMDRSLAAALTKLGVPSSQADLFAMGVWQGGSLVAIQTDDGLADEAAGIIDLYYPFDIDQLARHWQASKQPSPVNEFEAYDSACREHHRVTFSLTHTSYLEFQPAYRYGYLLGTNPACAGQTWDSLEERARLDWETEHPAQDWEQVREAVRVGWSLVASDR